MKIVLVILVLAMIGVTATHFAWNAFFDELERRLAPNHHPPQKGKHYGTRHP